MIDQDNNTITPMKTINELHNIHFRYNMALIAQDKYSIYVVIYGPDAQPSFRMPSSSISDALKIMEGKNDKLYESGALSRDNYERYMNALIENRHYVPDNKINFNGPFTDGSPELGYSGTLIKDNINPSHYKTKSGLEAINVIEEFELDKDFCLANATKYILRAGKKDGNSAEQDISKAIWYLERKLKQLNK